MNDTTEASTTNNLEDATLTSLGQPTKEEVKAIAARQKEITSAAPAGQSGRIETIALKDLTESPSNPRKRFHGLDELAGSILRQGLLQPLVVRSLDDGVKFEIIIGHRRFRAAKLAKLEVVRCEVRNLDDRAAAEAQLVENVQREDLTPLEEAHGYSTLLAEHGYTVDTIAACAKKSKGWVYSRLKLLALGPEARKALDDGFLPPSVAIPLARIPSHDAQAAALKGIRAQTTDGAPVNARYAIDYLQREFARNLREAPFDTKDEMLTTAGACSSCPKNARNLAQGLFEDFGKKPSDVCLDTVCFSRKAEASFAIAAADIAAKKGARIMTPEESAQAFPRMSQYLNGGALVALDEKCWGDGQKQRTWGELMNRVPEKERPEVAVAKDGTGKARQLVDRAQLTKALAEFSDVKWAKEELGGKEKLKKSRDAAKKEKTKAALVESVTVELARRLGAEAKKVGLGEAEARAVVTHLAESVPHSEGLSTALGIDDFRKLEKEIEGASRAELNAMAAVLLVFALCEEGDYSDGVKALAKARRIDLAKLEEVQKATLEAEEKKVDDSKKAKPKT